MAHGFEFSGGLASMVHSTEGGRGIMCRGDTLVAFCATKTDHVLENVQREINVTISCPYVSPNENNNSMDTHEAGINVTIWVLLFLLTFN